MLKSLNPSLKRSPYYVVAPHYIRTSAGIRCLHLLCHWLNRMGERAFLAIHFISDGSSTANPDLQTPILTRGLIDYHYELAVRPIIVYPEVVVGNPLEAECVIRWVLNFPGLLGGDAVFPRTEMLVGFSKVLAKAIGPKTPVLHMPVLNEEMFNPGAPRARRGVAFYAAKYKDVHNGKIFGVPKCAIEITRDKPNSQTPGEIAEILRSVELLYVFENTALATEAVLCGCPAVFMPNPWLDKPIALEELGWDGLAWGDDPMEIARARATVEQGQANYKRTVGEFFVQLDDFIERSQAKAAAGRYEHKINPVFLVPDNLHLYNPPGIMAGPITLRQYLRQFKAVVFLWMTIYRRPQMFLVRCLFRKNRAAAIRDVARLPRWYVSVWRGFTADSESSFWLWRLCTRLGMDGKIDSRIKGEAFGPGGERKLQPPSFFQKPRQPPRHTLENRP